ncbi:MULTISPECIES: hypothetical protein [Ruminococcus]|uniref:Conserved domain protein n=1 Tax=Ruminococcus albus 8 TaxID=246199 RepID=E9SHK5_RUMAL|nr:MULTISPECIES: hypothetical protein [Ruminococcus]EGC01157.1 conserved domain protein [Ruminococcus albus 8]MBE6874290.1 hypothetical protein [Ruminococcus albus]MBR0529970.1 hypothetical protein [Ruminococcus sp.]MCC3349620.1 hypothetical protein [Ruminococcus albus 8]
MEHYDLIDLMLSKPYIFTGESLTALRFFLNGYSYCRLEHKMIDSEPQFSLFPLPWKFFGLYVRCQIPVDCGEREWYYQMMSYYGDKEGYRMFCKFYSEFRRLEVSSMRRMSLNYDQISLYYELLDRKMETHQGEPEYEVFDRASKLSPQSVYIINLSDGTSLVALEDVSHVRLMLCFFKSEQRAEKYVYSLFTSFDANWFEVTGVSEPKFTKPLTADSDYIDSEL